MMAVDSGAIMRCIGCPCPSSPCVGIEYRVDNYSGQVRYRPNANWTWARVHIKTDEVEVQFPPAYPGHRWRNVARAQ